MLHVCVKGLTISIKRSPWMRIHLSITHLSITHQSLHHIGMVLWRLEMIMTQCTNSLTVKWWNLNALMFIKGFPSSTLCAVSYMAEHKMWIAPASVLFFCVWFHLGQKVIRVDLKYHLALCSPQWHAFPLELFTLTSACSRNLCL